jgi:hypothetical protein
MIYSKLEGTTSKQFKLGKNGIQFQLRENDPNVLEIATPDGGLFVIGLSEVFNEAGQVTQPNAIPTATQIKDYIADSIGDIIGGDFSNLQTAIEALEDRVADIIGDDYENLGVMLNSIKELAEAIGNDPNFFTVITNRLSLLDAPINTPNPGRVSMLEQEVTAIKSDISELQIRTTNVENNKLDRLSSLTTTTSVSQYQKPERDAAQMYVEYPAVDGQPELRMKTSVSEIRALRPGVYTVNTDGDISNNDVLPNDYVFVNINEG